MKNILLISALMVASNCTQAIERISLEQLLAEKITSPQQSISNTRLKIHNETLSQAQAEDDWEAFGSIGVAQNSELVTENEDREYSNIGGTIGLRYPLFGSMEAKENQVKRATSSIGIESYNLTKITYDDDRAITINYINYWSALLKTLATNQFLTKKNDTTEKLKQRVEKGLLYRSDYYEFQSAFALADRNLSVHKLEKQRSLNNIETITGYEVGDFIPVKPSINAICYDSQNISYIIQQNNLELKQLAKEIELIKSILENSTWSGIESDFSIKHSIGYETNPNGDTSSFAASINVRMPLDIGQYNHSNKQILKFKLVEKRAEYDLRQNELKQLAFNQYQNMLTKRANLEFQFNRLNGTEDSKKREEMRFKMIDGDVIEKVVQSNIKHYVQTIDYIEALRQYLISQALANMELTINCHARNYKATYDAPYSTYEIENSFKNTAVKDKKKTNNIVNRETNSLYVWKSEQLFKQIKNNPSYFKVLNNHGVNRLIVSLDASQIMDFSNTPAPLLKFIKTAEKHDIHIELLLGEPTWIYPENRYKLVTIIESLSDVPFRGIHLDIELDQLDESTISVHEQQIELLNTIKLVTRKTDLPITLITHPRYSVATDDFCLFCELEKTSIFEISLMIYRNNYQAVTAAASKIIDEYPGIKFSISQSIETGISSDNSYNHLDYNELSTEMTKLRSTLLQSNFNGIVIQSWNEFKELLLP